MKSKIAGVDLSLWCVEEYHRCPYYTDILGPWCKYFETTLLRDTRIHRDGSPIRIERCMAVDLEKDKEVIKSIEEVPEDIT
jgi:hypothetical protein